MKKKKKMFAGALLAVVFVGSGIFSVPGFASAQNDKDRDEQSAERGLQEDRSSSSWWGSMWNFAFPVIIKGEVKAINKNRIVVRVGEGRWARTVSIKITRQTKIIGDPSRGDEVRVIAYRDRSGYVAKKIKVIEPGYGGR